MSNGSEIKDENAGSLAGSYGARAYTQTFDPLRPWKFISQSNIFIIYLSVLLFALYAFSRYGFNWIALSTTLIVSIPIGFAIAFFIDVVSRRTLNLG